MAKRALILIEGHRSMGLLFVQAAQRLGLHPILLSANPAQYGYLAAEGIEAIRVDTDNPDTLILECSRLRTIYHIAGITGALDSVYATVGKLCQYFNLPGPKPKSIGGCCDKFAQRQLLAQAGVPIPAYRLAANATDVESSVAEIGLPAILKPAVGTGSRGVKLCRNVDELAEHTTYLLGRKHIHPPYLMGESSPRMLVEECVQGPHYSAEVMGSEVIGIAAIDWGEPPHFVLRGCSYPALLTDNEHRAIVDASLSCLRALDLGWGPTNIEFVWTKRGPVVIEVNPRLAGTPTPQLIQLAYGIDLVTEHLRLVIGEEWNLRRMHSHAAAARFLVAEGDGTLDWIRGYCRAAAIPGVAEVKLYVEPKSPILRNGDFRDCIGHVFASSPSAAQTEAIVQCAADMIRWSITPFPVIGD
ncbi:acetyl-CoA carboxylase biotin carboxylase subunit family protein [Aminobacter sp. BA135]|uniref:ATP-grasp domain-containing protein n=1 Tax=Aminobacter sp. BA135 TaxID=537596 RepID=UPI003D7B6497